jgi:uncharacterized membrane protein (UPF0182 family)
MYLLLLVCLLAGGALLVALGLRRRRPGVLWTGILVLLATASFFALLGFWGEMFWFEAMGHTRRFWTEALARLGVAVAAAGVAAFLLVVLLRPLGGRSILFRRWPPVVAVALGVIWGLTFWDRVLLFLYQVPTGLVDPVFGRGTSFYLFTLPLMDAVYWLVAAVALLAVLIAAANLLIGQSLLQGAGSVVVLPERRGFDPRAIRGVLVAMAFLLFVLASGKILNAWHLLFSQWGVVAGAGWTDIHVRLPGYGLAALVTVSLGLLPLHAGMRRRVSVHLKGDPLWRDLGGAALLWVLAPLSWLLLLGFIPLLVQWMVVEPNEITFEREYIAHNIRFTRHGFRLHEVEERQFPASETLTEQMVAKSEHVLSEARLWDMRALDAVYRQFQEMRLYYAFHDVDMDRYWIGDRYRQVMVSARELAQENLPLQSQTFVNLRFKYTHGYGLTLAAVRDFTPDGLPHLLVKDIPPRAEAESLAVTRPQIYYGELTGDPVVANSREAEFDHPSGDENVTIHYPGTGGVPLRNLWRKFVFGWMFDGTSFLFSVYPTPETRFLFHRQVADRVATLAPFLTLDPDPYIVLAEGRLYWILDAYTTSRYYPYSTPFSSREVIEYGDAATRSHLSGSVVPGLHGVNYARNSVKAVVDAFNGTVRLYVFDPADPIVKAWRRIYPELFHDQADMPAQLRDHVRYPAGFLLVQGLVYAKYHMGDPEVFYNQEDLWVRATEKYYDQLQPVEPYYVMWALPGSSRAEFVLILPFTPKNRQVLIGWIAGLCDADNYGRFLAYKFPKERRVLGPQQVETKIDQHRFLSGQLTLWDQRGSNVIRGNVLAIPIEDTLLYVEPIYLQADTAAYPELRLVVVMHGDNLSYGETFEAALEGLFTDVARASPAPSPAALGSPVALARRANEAFESYLRLQAEGHFSEAGRELERMRELLAQLAAGVEVGEGSPPLDVR